MANNSLSIHIDSGDIFLSKQHKQKFLYLFVHPARFIKASSFLFAQQDLSKQVRPKRIFYHHSFEKYIKNYLPSFLIEESEKFDLFSNKNSKYLLYNFNYWIEPLNRKFFDKAYLKSRGCCWAEKN